MCVSHLMWVVGGHALGSSAAAFLGALAGNWMRSRVASVQNGSPLQNTGHARDSLTHYATMLAPSGDFNMCHA